MVIYPNTYINGTKLGSFVHFLRPILHLSMFKLFLEIISVYSDILVRNHDSYTNGT